MTPEAENRFALGERLVRSLDALPPDEGMVILVHAMGILMAEMDWVGNSHTPEESLQRMVPLALFVMTAHEEMIGGTVQ